MCVRIRTPTVVEEASKKRSVRRRCSVSRALRSAGDVQWEQSTRSKLRGTCTFSGWYRSQQQPAPVVSGPRKRTEIRFSVI